MPDIAVTKCVSSTGTRNEGGVFGEFFSLITRILTAAASILMRCLLSSLFFLVRCTAFTNTVFGPGIPVNYTLRKRQNLAFLVQNYISFILITSFTFDIKLQKRWFPAQDLSVRITLPTTKAYIAKQETSTCVVYTIFSLCRVVQILIIRFVDNKTPSN